MLKEEVFKFLQATNQNGSCMSHKELLSVNSAINNVMPNWYIDFASSVPISGIEIDWQAYEPEEDFDGIETIQIVDEAMLKELNIDCYPGCYLNQMGYFVFGYGATNAGNCFAFHNDSKVDPGIYEVWHDAAHSIKELKEAFKDKKGVTLVANDIIQLFRKAIINEET